MIWTTAAFCAFTVAVGYWHVRRSDRHSVGADEAERRCPRCGGALSAGSRRCSSCGVPQQIFEVVASPTLEGQDSQSGVLQATVRSDMCVGCGTCVAACPEPGAITLRGKLAVVDAALCQGHGECAQACPIGAVTLSAGGGVNRMAVPLVDVNFQSNVPGLYIVGELGGRGLIKNAVNEGKLAIEHIGAEVARATSEARSAVAWDVAIVGSGPAGLSAALQALKLGLRYVVLEQGSLADTVRKYPRHKVLLAEPVRVPLYGDLWVADASKETLLAMWERVVANTGLTVRTGEKVEAVERNEGAFVVRTPNAAYEARRVVLAIGRRGSPRRLGVAGEDLDHVFYDIVEMEAFAGRKVLVVGGGDSAIESAVGLCNQPGTEVVLSYRGDSFARIKERNREKVDRAIASGRVRPIFNSHVREIRRGVVVLDVNGASTILPSDYVVVRIGGDAPYAMLERLGVRIVQKDVPLPQEAVS